MGFLTLLVRLFIRTFVLLFVFRKAFGKEDTVQEFVGGQEKTRKQQVGLQTWRNIEGLFTSSVDEGNQFVHEFISRKSIYSFSEQHEHVIINFYSSFCGHCQDYASTWRQIAKLFTQNKDNDVGVGALNCESFRNLCTSYKVDDVPTIIYFSGKGGVKPGSGMVVPVSSIEDVSIFVERQINREYKQAGNGKSTKFAVSKEANLRKSQESEIDVEYERKFIPASHNELKANLLNDIYIAVRFGLENDIFLGRKKLSDKPLRALQGWLKLLSRSLPGDTQRKLVHQLGDKLNHHLIESKHITSEDWDFLLANWTFAEATQDWKACPIRKVKRTDADASKRIRGGYSCALWLLFHTLSVSSLSGGMSAEATAIGIHGFVRFFFNCKECKQNFINNNPEPKSMLVTRHYHKKSKNNALILWLWNEHNLVSNRLERENPNQKRDLFPTLYHCPTCQISEHEAQQHDAYFNSYFPKHKKLQLAVQDRTWKLDTILKIVVASYCFDDSVLTCTMNSQTLPSNSAKLDAKSFLTFLSFLVFLFFAGATLKILAQRLNKKVH